MVRNILDRQNELALMPYRPDEKRLKIKVLGGENVLLIAVIWQQNLNLSCHKRKPILFPRYGILSISCTEALPYFQVWKNLGITLAMSVTAQDGHLSVGIRMHALNKHFSNGLATEMGKPMIAGNTSILPACFLEWGYMCKQQHM